MVRRNTLEQVYFTAVQALPMILPIATLIGAMIIVQFSKFSGQYDLGKITVLIIVRELGPDCNGIFNYSSIRHCGYNRNQLHECL